MDIRNATQFADFLSSSGLSTLDSSFIQIINCANNFRSMCNCYKASDKAKMYNQCNQMYANSVSYVIPKFKNQLLSKTSDRSIYFYSDSGALIGKVTR